MKPLFLQFFTQMSTAYNQNGFLVAPSKPSTGIRTTTKTVQIDSGDRDLVKYPRNGEFVIYLPRVQENVVSIRLKGAEFPSVNTTDTKIWIKSPSGSGALPYQPLYFFLSVDGLNRSDETMLAADRSTQTDAVFAKIQVPDNTNAIMQSEDSGPRNINNFYPPIGKVDRLAIRVRLHDQNQRDTDTIGNYIQWDDATTPGDHDRELDFALTVDIEMLDNSFNEASSFETRMPNQIGFLNIGS